MINARREGFALAATILAMLVVGAIVTGGFYAASQEGQVSRALEGSNDALYLAETGLQAAQGQLTARTLDSIAVNGSRTWAATNVTLNGTTIGNYRVTAARVNELLYIIRSVGTQTRGGRYAGAQREVATAVRIRMADFDNQAAVMIYGNLTVAGTSQVDGDDEFPSQWSGESCSTTSGTAAVLSNPTTTIRTQGSGQIDGTVRRDTLTSGDFTVFGDLTWNEVVAMRNITYSTSQTVGPSPSWSGSTCTTSTTNNWGHPLDPSNPCFTYFPVIYAAQNLRISSSSYGQGILLVAGDLEISGGFTFYGVVVVLGQIRITGTGGHINGTAMVYGGGDLGSTGFTAGNALLQYSSCAIERAVLNNNSLSRALPIRHRAWIDLSAVTGGN